MSINIFIFRYLAILTLIPLFSIGCGQAFLAKSLPIKSTPDYIHCTNSDFLSPQSKCPKSQTKNKDHLSAPAKTHLINVTNLTGTIVSQTPDPTIFEALGSDGQFHYFLSHTVSNHKGDLPLYTSDDLINWRQTGTLFDCKFNSHAYCQVDGTKSNGFTIGENRFCHVWGPDVFKTSGNNYTLTFSAVVVATTENCPSQYYNNGSTYIAKSIPGQYPLKFHFVDQSGNRSTRIAPLATALNCTNRGQKPMSIANQSRPMEGSNIIKNIYIDSSIFQDTIGQPWLIYTWNSNLYKYPNFSSFELENYGIHSAIVKLDRNNLTQVQCHNNIPISIVNSQSKLLLNQLRNSCPNCNQMLSLKGTLDSSHHPENFAVAEGGSAFYHQGRYYMLFSGSSWNSTFYHVFWISATSIEGLSDKSSNRRAGRYLVPSPEHGIGHGHPLKAPNNKWYYIYHHISDTCRQIGDCNRNALVSPIDFDAIGDIIPRFPVEEFGLTKTISQSITEHLPFESKIRDKKSGLCISIKGSFIDGGGSFRKNVTLDTCQNSENQIYWFTPVQWDTNFNSNTYYQIKSRNDGTCLTVNNAGLHNDANIMAYPCVNQSIYQGAHSLGNQYVKINKIEGRVQFELAHAIQIKQCISAYLGENIPNTNIVQNQCLPNPNTISTKGIFELIDIR